MKLELIQPFVNSMDAVLAEAMQAPVQIADLTMEEEGYRKKGLAAVVIMKGEIEGRIILDMEPAAAARVASFLADEDVPVHTEPAAAREPESEEIIRETVCELANMVIGNAITLLNDHGFKFKVHPPEVHTQEQLEKAGQDTEATVLCFDTPNGNVYMNISMRYNRRRARERSLVAR